MNKKTRLISDISIGIFIGSFFISIILFFCAGIQPRSLYYFPLHNSEKIYVETRRSQAKISSTKLEYYVDDLILGPMTNRFKPLFAMGTKVEFCFTKGRTAYIGLSKEALNVNDQVCTIEEGLNLLRLNIVRNFTNINKLYIYIDGREVLGE